jgi:hypothetical protein
MKMLEEKEKEHLLWQDRAERENPEARASMQRLDSRGRWWLEQRNDLVKFSRSFDILDLFEARIQVLGSCSTNRRLWTNWISGTMALRALA